MPWAQRSWMQEEITSLSVEFVFFPTSWGWWFPILEKAIWEYLFRVHSHFLLWHFIFVMNSWRIFTFGAISDFQDFGRPGEAKQYLCLLRCKTRRVCLNDINRDILGGQWWDTENYENRMFFFSQDCRTCFKIHDRWKMKIGLRSRWRIWVRKASGLPLGFVNF